MARHVPGGSFYTTDDLLRFASMNNFGPMSPAVGRALLRLKRFEEEVPSLRQRIIELENIQTIADRAESQKDIEELNTSSEPTVKYELDIDDGGYDVRSTPDVDDINF